MIQEDKQLLLKDLCARLPYKIICQMEDELIISDSHFYDCTLTERYIELFRYHKDFYIKPYLRPLSSMTEGEKKDYLYLCESHLDRDADDNVTYYYFDTIESFDWLNAHHFDYRGLIEKGIAIEVTEENNPYKD